MPHISRRNSTDVLVQYFGPAGSPCLLQKLYRPSRWERWTPWPTGTFWLCRKLMLMFASVIRTLAWQLGLREPSCKSGHVGQVPNGPEAIENVVQEAAGNTSFMQEAVFPKMCCFLASVWQGCRVTATQCNVHTSRCRPITHVCVRRYT